jgi:FAD/FMN-containing dehydrogenase
MQSRRRFLKSAALGAAAWPMRHVLASTPNQHTDLAGITLDGREVTLRANDVSDLAASLRGTVLSPQAPGYDAARRVWNGMIDRHPALVVRCASVSDVIRATNFAQSHRLLTAVRAGGHNVAGKSTCDGGIVIDVASMQTVRVDPEARIARVDGGALLGHLDRETAMFGLVTTAGTVSHTGAAGLTLGGGLGRVARRFGLACDNLRSVDVVTADGKFLTASEREHADLFWALRGGGGNFGIATSFEYRLHSMHPTILSGTIGWSIDQAPSVLGFWAEFASRAPDELALDCAVVRTPNGPIVVIEPCWSADVARGERLIEPLRRFGRPLFDKVGPVPYVALQSKADDRNAHGGRAYAKAAFIDKLDARAIEQLLKLAREATPTDFALVIQQTGGAIARRAENSTAFPNRSAQYWVMMIARWQRPEEDATHIAATRALWREFEPFTSGFYVNGMADDEYSRVAANYGANYPRLRQIKRRYDPGNQFRLNANILPA